MSRNVTPLEQETRRRSPIQTPDVTPDTLADLYNRLNRHDWWYMMSDDHQAYTNGRNNETALQRLSSSDPVCRQMFSDFAQWRDTTITCPDSNLVRPVLDDYLPKETL